MGEWKIQVPMKLDPDLVERMDRDVQRFAPFCEGRSAVGRELIRYAYDLIDAGIIEWNLEAVQRVRSNSRNGNPVPSIPSKPASAPPVTGWSLPQAKKALKRS